MAIARKPLMVVALACFGGVSYAQEQQLQTKVLSTENCATEGGEIAVQTNGSRLLHWSGTFCVSFGCSTYEISDVTDDGAMTLKADKSYIDGSVLSYTTTIHRESPEWTHNTPMNLDHGQFLKEDLRIVQGVFERTVRAVADGKILVKCS